jgi:hypothetical protein
MSVDDDVERMNVGFHGHALAIENGHVRDATEV